MCKTNRKIPSIFCLIFILSIFAFADTWQETSTSDFSTAGSSTDNTDVINDSVQIAKKSGWLDSGAPAWWDADWQYRKEIIINNTGLPLSDFQIKIENPVWNEASLMGSWHFEETAGAISGVTADTSGFHNDGTLTNFALPKGIVSTGKCGNAADFDGTNDYIITSLDVQPGAMASTTWEAWIYPTRVNYATRQQILAADDGGYDRAVLVEASTSNFGVFTGSGCWQPAAVDINQWQHIAVVYTSTKILFYKNGRQYTYTGAPSGQSSGNKLSIGWNQAVGEYFQGMIDEVRIYSRELSCKEITSHYNAKAKLNYGDIRFAETSGAEIPCWMEKDGTFWLKMSGTDSIPTGLSKIYAYYGNVDVSYAGSGIAIFELFDDFEDGNLTGWAVDSGTWIAVNKYAEGTSGGANNFLRASGFTPSVDYIAEYLSYSGTAIDGGIAFRYQDLNNTYASIIRNPSNDVGIFQKLSGSWTQKSVNAFSLNNNFWVKNKFIMNGNAFTSTAFYGQNGAIVSAENSWTDSSPAWTSGSFALYDYNTSDGRIDNVFVRKYAAAEPVIYVGYEVAKSSQWAFRKTVNITNSGAALSNYEFKVENPIYNETGLLGSWHFEEGAGTVAGAVADTGGLGKTGALYNFANPNGIVSNGKCGNALSFDGANDVVTIGSLGAFPAQGAIEFWMTTSEVLNYRNPLTTRYNGGNSGIRFEEDTTGTFRVITGNDSGTNDYRDFFSSAIQTNTWYHIVYVWNTTANTEAGYLNGTPIFSGSHTLWPTTIPDLRLGVGFSDSAERYWKGLLDEVRVYSRELQIAEIFDRYQAAKAKLNYGDIRFTNTSGLNLPYYMEKDGTFWVKVLGQNSIPAGQSDIYLYYGNTSAVDDSRQDYFVSSSAGLISGGKTYTFITPQWDYYIDSGGRLTNGFVREVIYGSTEATVGWPGDRDPIIKIDLGAVYQVFQYKIYCGGGGEGGILFPSTLTIDVSTDDINWTTAVSNTGYTDIEQWAVLNSSAVFARYVKFNVIRRGNWGTWTMLGELEVYQSESAASLPVVFGTEQNSYNALGTFTSCVKDTGGDNTVINSIAWTTTGAGAIAMQVRAANSNSGWTASSPAWEDVTVNPDSDISTIGRYIQYRATFSGSELTAEPLLADVTITYTLPIAPPADSVSCDKLANTWYSTAVFTFTNTAGFGAQIDKYYYAWDNTASYTFTLTEPVWNSLTPQLQNSSTSDGLWYFHYLPYSSTNTPGVAQDLGPFKFDGTPPAALTLSSPDVNASISSTTASFSWQGVSDTSGVSYLLLLDHFTTFAAPVIAIPNLAGTSYALSGSGDEILIGSSTYYWRVTTVDGAGNSTNSVYRKFTTSSSLPQVYNESTGESYAGLQDALANSLDGDSLVINDTVSYDENLIITSDISLSNAVISPAAGFAVTGQGLAGGEVLRNCVITSGGISGLALGENLTLFNPDPNETLVIENSRLVNCLIELGADITNCTLENCALEVTPDYFVNATTGDFHLAAAAVNAIDKGKNLSSEFAIDKDGIDRGIDVLDVDNFDSGGWDIGAYEFVLASGYINNGSGTGGDGTVSYAVMASDPGTLAFYSIGSSIMLLRTFAISKTGTLDVNWSLSDDMDWLSMDTVSGSGAAGTDVTASVDITGLTAGAYSGNITVTAPGAENSPLSIPVTLEISADESEYVLVSCEPSGLSFSAEYGSTGEISGELTLSKNGSIDFNWTISGNAAWISVSPYAGTSGSSVDITVTVNASGLTAGMHSAEITVTAPGALNSPLSIPVSIVIYETDADSDSSQGNSSPDNSLPGGFSAGNSSTGNNSTGGTTAGSMPSKPLLQLPANGMTDVFPAPVLGWAGTGSSNTTYWLELGEDAEFSQMLVSKMMNSTIYQTAGVQYGKVYYWRVKALNGAGASDWSETYWFQMKSNGESTDNGGKVSGCFIKKIRDKK